jgi:hypothetical protein
MGMAFLFRLCEHRADRQPAPARCSCGFANPKRTPARFPASSHWLGRRHDNHGSKLAEEEPISHILRAINSWVQEWCAACGYLGQTAADDLGMVREIYG